MNNYKSKVLFAAFLSALCCAIILLIFFLQTQKPVLFVEKTSIQKSGAIFYLYNKSVFELTLGEEYCIQKKEKNAWYDLEQLQHDEIWPLYSIVIKPKESTFFKIDWTNRYGALPAGKYRIVKKFGRSSRLQKSYNIYCEFEIL